jgi:hypothetical protein
VPDTGRRDYSMPRHSATTATCPGEAGRQPAKFRLTSIRVSRTEPPGSPEPRYARSAGIGRVTSAIRHLNRSKEPRSPWCTSAPIGQCAVTGARSTSSMMLPYRPANNRSPGQAPCRCHYATPAGPALPSALATGQWPTASPRAVSSESERDLVEGIQPRRMAGVLWLPAAVHHESPAGDPDFHLRL